MTFLWRNLSGTFFTGQLWRFSCIQFLFICKKSVYVCPHFWGQFYYRQNSGWNLCSCSFSTLAVWFYGPLDSSMMLVVSFFDFALLWHILLTLKFPLFWDFWQFGHGFLKWYSFVLQGCSAGFTEPWSPAEWGLSEGIYKEHPKLCQGPCLGPQGEFALDCSWKIWDITLFLP